MRVAFRLQDLTQGAGAAREYVAKCSKADLSSSGRSPSISASAVPGGRRGVPLPLSVTRIAESEASSATAEPEVALGVGCAVEGALETIVTVTVPFPAVVCLWPG